MAERRDIVVLGAGIAGLTAAWHLRDRDVLVLDADDHVGGRTLSEDLEGGGWANYAAQYVSDDKTTVIALCDALGLDLVPSGFDEAAMRAAFGLDEAMMADVAPTVARLEAEQARPRPLDDPALDAVSFAEWLGDVPDHVRRYFEHWAGSLMFASAMEMSLVGAMMLWGEQRSSPFTDPPVTMSNRGDTVIRGGTNRMTRALAAESGAEIRTGNRVVAARIWEDDVVLDIEGPDGSLSIGAGHAVCALPAPVALEVVCGLPDWKADALAAIRYGRNIATPVAIAPADAPLEPWSLVPSRAGARYNSNDFVLRTPGDFETAGGCLHSYVYDAHARVIWDDPDDSIRSGTVRAVLERFPHYEGRIRHVGLRRWRHALPHYSVGRMARQPAIEAPVGRMSFAGDYVITANMDGAARSGQAAAAQILADGG